MSSEMSHTSEGGVGEKVTPVSGAPEGEVTVAQRREAWTLSDAAIKGRTVVTSDGQKIGSVTEIRIDVGTWRVTSLEVAIDRPMHRTLGVKRELLHRTTMAVPTELVHSVKDAVVLAVTTAELRHRVSDFASVH